MPFGADSGAVLVDDGDGAAGTRPSHGPIRVAGITCLAAGFLGALSCGYLTATNAVAPTGAFSYPHVVPGATALQIVLALSQIGLIYGLVALGRTNAGPRTRRGRFGYHLAVALMAGLIVAEGIAISVPVTALDATPPAFGLVYAGYTLLLGLALVLVGLETARAGAPQARRRWLPFAPGLWLIVVLFPTLALHSQAAGWARAAWLILFGMLGLALARAAPAVRTGAYAPSDTGGRSAHSYAIVTWVYAAAFGSPTLPVAGYLIQNERLPSFFDAFEMYGGARTEQLQAFTLSLVLLGYLAATALAALAAGRIRDGSRPWAVIALLLLPVEAALWFVFYQPLPWAFGVVRVVLLVTAWPTLRWRRGGQTVPARSRPGRGGSAAASRDPDRTRP